MSKLAEFRAAEKALADQLAHLEALKNDSSLKKEIEFEGKLNALLADYGKSLKDVVAILDPESQRGVRTTGAKPGRRARAIGPMIATALVAAIGDARQFANGRQFAASLGLTPRQHSSGGKDRLLGISKRGDAYLRTLMIHGARSVLRTAPSKDDRLSQWAVRLAERSHTNVAAIALANKTARMAWAMLRNGTAYQPERAAA